MNLAEILQTIGVVSIAWLVIRGVIDVVVSFVDMYQARKLTEVTLKESNLRLQLEVEEKSQIIRALLGRLAEEKGSEHGQSPD